MADVEVRPAPPEMRRAALALLSGSESAAGVPDVESLLETAGPAGLSLKGLLVAEAGGTLVGAALYVLQPAGVAFVWPPGVAAEAHLGLRAAAARALLEAICHRLDEDDCRLAQCLLETDSRDGPLMEQHGFRRLTELSYLERPLDAPLPAAPGTKLESVEFDPRANRARFVELLAATYEGTEDCPELNGRRTADEAIAAHRATGRFDPRLWKLYRGDGRDAAILLLTDHPELRAWEIVYMGVAPTARGRGLGLAMLTEALHEAQSAGREALVLAVDVRNRYARSVYEQLGFHELCRRIVHLRLAG